MNRNTRRVRALVSALVLGGVIGVAPVSGVLALAPPNDDIAAATTVTGVPFTDVVDTTDATFDPTDPSDCWNSSSAWYMFTPATDRLVELNTVGSSYDTTVGVYVGSPGALSLIQCVDDNGGLQARFLQQLDAGVTYYFMVGVYGETGLSGVGGTLQFNVVDPPPPLDIEITVDPVASFDPKTGAVTLRGTVTCNTATGVGLHGTLRQKVGRVFITSDVSGYVECTGASTTAWTAAAVSFDGLMKGGRVTLNLGGSACDLFTCDYTEFSGTVRLRGK